jgi:tetratricopeptide (TPR) repeat protein
VQYLYACFRGTPMPMISHEVIATSCILRPIIVTSPFKTINAMKPFLLLLPTTILFTVAINRSLKKETESYQSIQETISIKKQNIISCSPNFSLLNLDDNPIPLLKGWGNYRMKVTVKNDSANIYFQQGINMYYSFHIIEALASFDKAIKFDEKFAMGWWGKALSYGPNINDLGYAASPEALESIKKAEACCAPCSKLEQAMIAAMKTRYTADTTQSRENLNEIYADAMKNVYAKFPNSADAAALYADALMVQHPWDLYDRHYQPKAWTPEIVTVLEKLITRFPNNPGANHYYIHAVEGSTHPEKALPVANKLGAMMPGVSHLVHMPSHIYIRSGDYNKGIKVNTTAIDGYNNYLSEYAPVNGGVFLYLLHNQHMECACAIMDGQYANSIKYAQEMSKNIDASLLDAGGFFGVSGQYLDMTGTFAKVRFGKWDDILNEPAIAETRVFSSIMQHFARGMAFARKQQAAAAEEELLAIQNVKTNDQLKESPPAFNPGIAAVNVAEKILQGAIAEAKNELPKAKGFYKEATDIEEGMLYNEPRDWQLPARHYLGNVLLKMKQYNEAEKVYKEDLIVNPNNAWSLAGLLQALQKQKKKTEAAAIQQQLKKATMRADVKIEGSVF